MNASLVPSKTDAHIALIKDQYGQKGLSLKVPFETTIMLYENVVIAGTTHVEDIDEIVETLSFPVDVQLQRDPNNLHDKWAIKVLYKSQKIGYVPCDINEILAKLMDGGKRLKATIFDNNKVGRWNKLFMEISLID